LKDTANNILATKEFVINLVSEPLAEPKVISFQRRHFPFFSTKCTLQISWTFLVGARAALRWISTTAATSQDEGVRTNFQGQATSATKRIPSHIEFRRRLRSLLIELF
jgi:flavin reductase (DIM6/NTAB) family NADH-FMN oxidoreductase RutF